jgi:hypothetical protein
MNKKVLMGLGAVLAVAAGIVAMSAFEAHVINVTAHIENALDVHPDEIAFGTVFPQEYVERQFTVEMSQSFQGATRVDDIEYVIKQKPKCECDLWEGEGTPIENCPEGQYAPVDYATHLCPEGYTEMESLCPFLSKVDADPGDENDTSHPSYYVVDAAGDYCVTPITVESSVMNFSPTGWAGWSCPAGTRVVGGTTDCTEPLAISKAANADDPQYPTYPHYTYTPPEEGWVVQNGGTSQSCKIYVDCLASAYADDATGRLSKLEGDWSDLWTVDLKVPPVDGYVGQDWPAGCPTVPTNDVDYGCDLWIEVTGISEMR